MTDDAEILRKIAAAIEELLAGQRRMEAALDRILATLERSQAQLDPAPRRRIVARVEGMPDELLEEFDRVLEEARRRIEAGEEDDADEPGRA